MTEKIKLAVLISGRGSNLQSLIDACDSSDFPAKIEVVISNISGAFGLERAGKAGIPYEVVDHKAFENKAAFEAALKEKINSYAPDLLCLAGFMRVLSAEFVKAYPENGIVNIHPSLLPAYKGLHTHERAIEAGEKKSGCTVHFVRAEVDAGPIIVQKEVPIMEGDTPDMLAERVLIQEHIAYPEAIRKIAQKG